MNGKNELKCRNYTDRITDILIGSGYCNKVDDTAYPLLLIPVEVPRRRVVALCWIYSTKIRISMSLSAKPAPASLPQITERMNELNRNLDEEMGYGFDNSGSITFKADYHFHKHGPDDDPRLEGFCELIGRTAPNRLDEIVGMGMDDNHSRPQ